jgi:SAM-dependent methyltransferase
MGSDAIGRLEERAQVRRVFEIMFPYYAGDRRRDAKFVAQQQRVLAMLEGRRGDVLDVGCGPGLMTEALLSRGWRVTGVDLLEPAVAAARAAAIETRVSDRAHYLVGDADSLAFRGGRFDAVIAMGVLEYLPSSDGFLGEVHRVLRPGGVVVLTVPTSISPSHLSTAFLDGVVAPIYRTVRRLGGATVRRGEIPPHPCRPVRPWRLRRALRRAGFGRLRAAYVNFTLYPVSRVFPDFSERLDRALSGLGESRWLGWLGTQYVLAGLRADASGGRASQGGGRV